MFESPPEDPPRDDPEPDEDAADPNPQRHSLLDDVQGFLMAGVFCSLGVTLFGVCGLMTGGTAGLAFLLHYVTGLGVGKLFFLINLPFFGLAIRRMGWVFTIKSFISVGLFSLLADLTPRFVKFAEVTPLYSALAGGLLLGMGVLAFVRHGSSLGGINILAVYLQNSRGLRAGKIQMGVDVALALVALFVLDPVQVLYSALGALVLGAVLALNHRPGRYMGV